MTFLFKGSHGGLLCLAETCQNNVTVLGTRSRCQWPSLPVEQYYKVVMSADCGLSHVGTCPEITLDVART